MKQICNTSVLILLIALLFGCHRSSLDSADNPDTSKSGIDSCQIQKSPNDEILAVISCPDGSTLEVPKNKNGIDGVNGGSCRVESVEDGALITCEDGSQAFVRNGMDGHSCSVSSINAHASLVQCTDGSQSLIDLNSLTSFTLQEFIDPCGDDPNHPDEVLLLFTNGDILSYFESGSNRFLSKLQPGNYKTTDHQKCSFLINEEGNYIAL